MKRGFFSTSEPSPASATAPPKTPPAPPIASSSTSLSSAPLPSSIPFTTSPTASSTTLHWILRPDSALYITSASLAALSSTRAFTQLAPLPALPPYYERKDSPDKIGDGLFATRDIPRGELILLDRPLLVYDSQRLPLAASNRAGLSRWFEHALSRLSPERQAEFLALSNCFASTTSTSDAILGRIETNAHPIISLDALPNADAVTYSAVCPIYSRLNHACDANVMASFEAEQFAVGVRTTRDVRSGEELCVSYVVPMQKRRERREECLVKWRFECRCGWCSLSDEESAKKDEEREKMAELFLKQWHAQQGER